MHVLHFEFEALEQRVGLRALGEIDAGELDADPDAVAESAVKLGPLHAVALILHALHLDAADLARGERLHVLIRVRLFGELFLGFEELDQDVRSAVLRLILARRAVIVQIEAALDRIPAGFGNVCADLDRLAGAGALERDRRGRNGTGGRAAAELREAGDVRLVIFVLRNAGADDRTAGPRAVRFAERDRDNALVSVRPVRAVILAVAVPLVAARLARRRADLVERQQRAELALHALKPVIERRKLFAFDHAVAVAVRFARSARLDRFAVRLCRRRRGSLRALRLRAASSEGEFGFIHAQNDRVRIRADEGVERLSARRDAAVLGPFDVRFAAHQVQFSGAVRIHNELRRRDAVLCQLVALIVGFVDRIRDHGVDLRLRRRFRRLFRGGRFLRRVVDRRGRFFRRDLQDRFVRLFDTCKRTQQADGEQPDSNSFHVGSSFLVG